MLQHCEYGFTVNIPLQVALADNFLLATHFNGQPISPDHGYPLRGVVGSIPARNDLSSPYFWKGGKWLRGAGAAGAGPAGVLGAGRLSQ